LPTNVLTIYFDSPFYRSVEIYNSNFYDIFIIFMWFVNARRSDPYISIGMAIVR
jgi:hypothetical protein